MRSLQESMLCFFSDILVFSENKKVHEKHSKNTMQKLNIAGIKLNKDKCQFCHKDGMKADPRKTETILEMPNPTDVAELHCFLGMVNYLGRYLQNLSSVLQPVTELLEKDRAWTWGPPQISAVTIVKEMLTSAPTLAYFDPDKATTVSADTRSYGLGAVLLQEHPDGLHPVAFVFRTLTKSERKYAQIKKECLASTWVCEKFDRYLVELNMFSVVTHHKPLVPLINTKDLSKTPLRCQRMLMCLMRFDVKAKYVPGKDMLVADTLTRSPVSKTESSSHEEIQSHVSDGQSSWQVSDAGLAKIRAETLKDVNLKAAMEYTIHGWTQYKEDIQLAARDFFIIRGELSLLDGFTS